MAPVVIVLLYGAGYAEVDFLPRGNVFHVMESTYSQMLLHNKDIFSSGEEENNSSWLTESTYRGYVVGWNYYEAQTSAARNMLGLQYWAASVDFAVVEPFVYNSFFTNKPYFDHGESLRFRDYFDLNSWNHHVTRNGFAKPLVSWEEFIEKASRKLIVVYVTMKSSGHTTTVTQNIIRSQVIPRGFTNEILSKYGFTVVKSLHFSFYVGSRLKVDDFNSKIFGDYDLNDVSVVFPFVPGVSGARINIERSNFPNFIPWLQPSRRIIKDSKKYAKTYLQGKQYVGIQLRTVKLALSLKKKIPEGSSHSAFVETYLQKCTKIIGDLILKLPGKHFLAVDIGRFGDPKQYSHMKRPQLSQTLDNLVSTIYDGQWNGKQWEESFINITGGITDDGYIASLQKLLVSNASYLITAGGGNFQASVTAHHKKIATEKDTIFSVCQYDEIKEML